jgi:hypothetical protein
MEDLRQVALVELLAAFLAFHKMIGLIFERRTYMASLGHDGHGSHPVPPHFLHLAAMDLPHENSQTKPVRLHFGQIL